MNSFATTKSRGIAPLLQSLLMAVLLWSTLGVAAAANILYPADDLIADRARYDATSDKVAIDDLLLPAPLLLTFSRHAALDDIYIGYERRGKSLPSSFSQLATGTRYVWLDDCAILANFIGLDARPSGSTCAIFGTRGHTPQVLDLNVDNGVFRFLDLFASALNEQAPDQDQKATLQQGLQGDVPVVVTEDITGLAMDFPGLSITSAGFGRGDSTVRTVTHASLDTGIDLTLDAGLNLVGIFGDGSAHLIDNVFNCDPSFDITQHLPWYDVVSAQTVPYSFYAVVAHDTGFCGAGVEDFAAIYEYLPLTSIKDIEFRKPYIGVFKDDASFGEFSNSASTRTKIFVPGAIEVIGDFAQASDLPAISTVKARQNAPDQTVATAVIVSAPTEAIPQSGEFRNLADITPHKLASGCTYASSKGGAAGADLSQNWTFGQDLSEVFKASSGFWNIEAEGAWFGAPRGEWRFDLGAEVSGPVALRIQGATYQGRGVKIWSHYDVDETYYGQQVQGEFIVDIPLPTAGTDSAVSLPLVIETANYSCPKSDGFGEDTRALSIYIKGMQIVAGKDLQPSTAADKPIAVSTQTAQPLTQITAPADTVADTTEFPVSTCETYQGGPAPLPRITPLWIGQNMRLSEALDNGVLALGNGWWPQTRGGYRVGSTTGRIQLRLPDIDEPLSLVLATRDATTFGVAGLRWRNATITPTYINDRTAVRFDVSDLPRGQMLGLELMTDPIDMSCAQAGNGRQYQSGPLISTVWLGQSSLVHSSK